MFRYSTIKKQFDFDLDQLFKLVKTDATELTIFPNFIRDFNNDYDNIIKINELNRFLHRYDKYIVLDEQKGKMNTSDTPNMIAVTSFYVLQFYRNSFLGTTTNEKLMGLLGSIPLEPNLKNIMNFATANVMGMMKFPLDVFLKLFSRDLEMEVVTNARKVAIPERNTYIFVNLKELENNKEIAKRFENQQLYDITRFESDALFIFLEIYRFIIYIILMHNHELFKKLMEQRKNDGNENEAEGKPP